MRPSLSILEGNLAERIIEEAFSLLGSTGVEVEHAEALEILHAHGAGIEGKVAFIPEPLISRSLQTVPESYNLYDRSGDTAYPIGGDNVFFDPGSAALYIVESGTRTVRKGLLGDVVDFVKLVAGLPHIALQSTGVIPSDIPENAADQIRLYIALLLCRKPVITGTFTRGNFFFMKEMLEAVRGSEKALREKPLAVFDCCPSQPLKWSDLTCHDLIAAARAGIPAELISMPLAGGTAPVTLSGALVQHTAETLSGVVIHQCTAPGAPLMYGGSPAIMDMRNGSSPMGAIETVMIDTAYTAIGKRLGMPTHSYLGMSDSKTADYQSGLESAIGAVMAGLAGVNIVSGLGMLNFENCQSFEKLVIDNEIAGMVNRLLEGIVLREEPIAAELEDCHAGVNFLSSDHTSRWFRKEHFFPGPVIDRGSTEEWEGSGKKTAEERASVIARRHIESYAEPPLPVETARELAGITRRALEAHDMPELPAGLPE